MRARHLTARTSLYLGLLLSIPAAGSGGMGLLDTSFGLGGQWFAGVDAGGLNFDTVQALAVQPDGRVVFAGWVSTAGGGQAGIVGRLSVGGSLDPSFGSGAGWVVNPFFDGNMRFEAVALQSDGKIVVAGTYRISSTDSDLVVGRLTSGGNLDTTFGPVSAGYTSIFFDLSLSLRDELHAVALQSDGKIVVAGAANVGSGDDEVVAARLLPNGSPDLSFSDDGKGVYPIDFFGGGTSDVAHAIAIAADGKILLGGQASSPTDANFALVRLLPNGNPDSTFGASGRCMYPIDLGGNDNDRARAVAIAPDGGYLLAGEADHPADRTVWVVMKVSTTNCNRDTSFNYPSGLLVGTYTCGSASCNQQRDSARAMVVQSDGRILIAGEGWGGHGLAGPSNQDFGIARLLPDGLLDPTFGSGGVLVVDFTFGIGGDDDSAYALALAPDGRIVVGGHAEWKDFNVDLAVVRLLDPIFADGFESGTSAAWAASAP